MFLNKYKCKKQIGQGGFGQVYLIEDQKGRSYALKLIPVEIFQEDPELRDNLNEQIACMKEMNSNYIIKLHEVHQDYCKYCNGGDLMTQQYKLPGRVFTLEKATEILAEVIIGLEQLHRAGYLHRDIKPQNVLIHRQNGKDMYKLADFGFTKKKQNIGGTILGTEQFMSPEIYSGDEENPYGFEVDMWAFGVLFYFMLNLEFPFKINTRYQPERKAKELRQIAKKFSYSAFVEKGAKKIKQNCTKQVEDLFSQIFDLNPQTRINFSEIRQHPVFAKHFPVINQASKKFYSNKYKSNSHKVALRPKEKILLKKSKSLEQEENAREVINIKKIQNKTFPLEKQVIDRKKDQIKFLGDNAIEFLQLKQPLNIYQKLMLGYNLQKYYIILLRKFKSQLNEQSLYNSYPDLNWIQYTKTQQFKDFEDDMDADLYQSQIKFINICEETQFYLKQISQINSKFGVSFHRQITETNFQSEFKQSYRKSTIHTFKVLRQNMTNNKAKGNKLNYILSLLVISHAFNNIFSDFQNLSIILKDYLQEMKRQVDKIDYSELREWMSKCPAAKLNNIVKFIFKIYFGG